MLKKYLSGFFKILVLFIIKKIPDYFGDFLFCNLQIRRFFRRERRAYNRIITPRILSSIPPYGKYFAKIFVSADAPKTKNNELPQQRLPEIRIPIIPPKNPIFSPF